MAKTKSKTTSALPSSGYFSLDRTAAPRRRERFKPQRKRPLGYRWYDPDRKVLGKRMEDQLRFAVCYWHSFVWPGTDPFGGDTFQRPWHAAGGDPMAAGAAEGRRRLRAVPPAARALSSPSTTATSPPRARRCANRT